MANKKITESARKSKLNLKSDIIVFLHKGIPSWICTSSQLDISCALVLWCDRALEASSMPWHHSKSTFSSYRDGKKKILQLFIHLWSWALGLIDGMPQWAFIVSRCTSHRQLWGGVRLRHERINSGITGRRNLEFLFHLVLSLFLWQWLHLTDLKCMAFF